jgi:hypothetical protein
MQGDVSVHVSDAEHEIVSPMAAPVIASLRAIGYGVETAVADLIDNSLDAGARHIHLTMDWNYGRSYLRIEDDGCGMDQNTLKQAMRLGSKDPNEPRRDQELGRFGLGLKTASFSLGKRLTVLTRQQGTTHVRCWDLDIIAQTNEWLLRCSAFDDSVAHLGHLAVGSGTVVLVEHLDRLAKKEDRFYAQVAAVKAHLRLVFHRFLDKNGGPVLTVNGVTLTPWDPFGTNLPGTEQMPPETRAVNGRLVTIQAFVLPHHTKLSKVEYETLGSPLERLGAAQGADGWLERQGFYIYRNQRLLTAGGWLNLFPRDSASMLARVRVDFDQLADSDWQIDVKKAVAKPPQEVLDDLRRVADEARKRSHKVYYYRGQPRKASKAEAAVALEYVWEQSTSRGQNHFQINRAHPLLQRVRAACTDEARAMLDVYLKMVQEFSPVNTVAFIRAEDGAQVQTAVEEDDAAEMWKVAQVYRELGVKDLEAAEHLKAMPVFAQYAVAEILRVIRREAS